MAWCNWLVEVILPSEILEVFFEGVGCVISCGDVLCYIGCGMVGYGMVWYNWLLRLFFLREYCQRSFKI